MLFYDHVRDMTSRAKQLKLPLTSVRTLLLKITPRPLERDDLSGETSGALSRSRSNLVALNAHSSGDTVAESIVPRPVERDWFPDPVVLESMDLSGDTVEASFHSNMYLIVESAATRHLSDAAAANTPRLFAEAGTPTLSVEDPFAKKMMFYIQMTFWNHALILILGTLGILRYKHTL